VPTGLRVKLKIATDTNTGAATLNMDGIGDVAIVDDQGVALHGGELVANAYTDLLYNGTNWIFLYSHAFFIDLITGGDGIIIATQVFKVPGTFTYTPSSELVQCAIVECIGGGGGGGAGWTTLPDNMIQGGGGGSGGYSRKTVNRAEIGVSQVVTVGAGGTGTTGNGNVGGGTSFGALCVANGGGGASWGNFSVEPTGGAGAAAGTGDVAVAGTPGSFGWLGRDGTVTYTTCGDGAPGPLGGGSQGHTTTVGGNATGYGAGGAGGSSWAGNGDLNGGSGSGGLVIVTEFGGRGSPGRDGNDGAPGPTGPMGPAGPAGAGTGDVLVSGTPVVGQVAQWTSTSEIRGVDPATVFSAFSTGDIKPTFKITADTGWVMLDDRTIGSGTSGATNRANSDTVPLFALLWTNCADADAPVSGGRGASAAADFAANKTITLPKAMGRAMMGAGAGASLTSRALGSTVGEERHTQSIAEMPAHSHPAPGGQFILWNGYAGYTVGGDGLVYNGGAATTNTANTGGGTPFNVMQPSFAVNFMCKL
jgi:hypothetical protein